MERASGPSLRVVSLAAEQSLAEFAALSGAYFMSRVLYSTGIVDAIHL